LIYYEGKGGAALDKRCSIHTSSSGAVSAALVKLVLFEASTGSHTCSGYNKDK
jgi:hypothetical protein